MARQLVYGIIVHMTAWVVVRNVSRVVRDVKGMIAEVVQLQNR